MKKEVKLNVYSPEEELTNAITHALGIFGGISCFVYLWMEKPRLTEEIFWSCSVFLITAIILYTSSTLYHSLRAKKQKLLFKKLDHISI